MLRYLTTSVIINKKRKNVLKDIVRVLLTERNAYSDPITEFLISLYVDFDFDTAHLKLKECEKLLANDFFLGYIANEFLENARLLIFETYCRIHKRININQLAEKLNFSAEEAETKIVELIRSSRIEAKIDSKNNLIVVTTDYPSTYQQVIDKTKSLSYRTAQMVGQLDKKLAGKVEE